MNHHLKENVDEAEHKERIEGELPTVINSVVPAGSRRSFSNYTNNTEYRQCLRQVFQMNSKNYPETIEQIPDLDDETRDEMSYDETAASATMDYILATTKDNPLFQTLYDLAAGRMFSTDRDIGLTVLLSYDLLKLFYPCFIDFVQNRSSFNESSQSYCAVHKALQ